MQSVPTLQPDKGAKTVQCADGKSVRLQVWDMPGQQRLWALAKNHMQGADAVIFIYDMTDEISFAEIENWSRKFNEENNNPDAVKILIGNKNEDFQAR